MKTCKLATLIVLFFSMAFGAMAQGSNFTDSELTKLGTSLNEVQGNYYLKSQTRKIEGDPYFNDEWAQGKVIINDKAETGQVRLRYNMEDNLVEFVRDNQIYLIDSNKIAGFTFYSPTGNITFRKGYRSDKYDISRNTFLQVLYKGNISFVAHHWASLKKDLPTYGSANINDKYVDNVEYYVIDRSGDFKKIRLRERDVLRSMEKPYRNSVNEYAESNNFNFKDPNDLKLLFEYYNSLLAEKQ